MNDSPQRPPLGLVTEKISGSAFIGPRSLAAHSWVYRVKPSVVHGRHTPYKHETEIGNPKKPDVLNPDSQFWKKFPLKDASDWLGQRLVGRSGDPLLKTGFATWIFKVSESMKPQSAFANLDGDILIVPQTGALDVTTELGRLVVRANEIAVIPRGLRYHVDLAGDEVCQGYICELFQGHFRLPELGMFGTAAGAHIRDFQIPTAHLDGKIIDKDGVQIATSAAAKWTIYSRLDHKLYSCEQDRTPFDVAAWHGTLYPYKYDLSKFDFLSNVHYGHKDPSGNTVLTVPAYGKAPGTAVVDIVIFGKRYEAAMDTHPLPWYHRNTMNEFSFPTGYPPATPDSFDGMFYLGAVTAHGPEEEEYKFLQTIDTTKPALVQENGLTMVMFESECPLVLTEWGWSTADNNVVPAYLGMLGK